LTASSASDGKPIDDAVTPNGGINAALHAETLQDAKLDLHARLIPPYENIFPIVKSQTPRFFQVKL